MNARQLLATAVSLLCFFATEANAQQQVRNAQILIDQRVANALLLKKVIPVYSDAVMSVNISGQIAIAFTIDKTGKVSRAMVVERDLAGRKSVNAGDPHLQQASLDAVKQWTYRPYMLNGAPVDVDTSIVLVFDFTHPKSPLVKIGEPGSTPANPKAALNAVDNGKTSVGEFGKPLIDPKVVESRLTGRVEPQYPQMARRSPKFRAMWLSTS